MLHFFVKIQRYIVGSQLFRVFLQMYFLAIDIKTFCLQSISDLQGGYRTKDLSAFAGFCSDFDGKFTNLGSKCFCILFNLGSLVGSLANIFFY